MPKIKPFMWVKNPKAGKMEETEIFQADDGYWYYKNSRERAQGVGIASDLGNVGAELFLTKGIPYLGKKAVEMAPYYGSEALRNPTLQKKAIDFALNKLNPPIHNVGSEALNQLSPKIKEKIQYEQKGA